jgi:pimeloyl-ACP methyl ester carboxylesterase
MVDDELLLSDGRVLAYTDCGVPSGPLVMYCHGAPGGRLDLVWLESAFNDLGARVVAADRPGYGGSTPQASRHWNDWPTDVAALADHLDVERFAVMGLSSGGPYAAACAALLPERVASAGIIAGVTDMGWPDAWDGYEEDEAILMRLGDEAAAVAWCTDHYGPQGDRFFDSTGELAPADLAIMDDEAIMAGLLPTFAEAFRQGIGGFAQDMTVQGTPWSFDPALISAPTVVYHGEADTMVPLSHGRHTTDLVPGATLRTFPEDGHISMITKVPQVTASLIAS